MRVLVKRGKVFQFRGSFSSLVYFHKAGLEFSLCSLSAELKLDAEKNEALRAEIQPAKACPEPAEGGFALSAQCFSAGCILLQHEKLRLVS